MNFYEYLNYPQGRVLAVNWFVNKKRTQDMMKKLANAYAIFQVFF